MLHWTSILYVWLTCLCRANIIYMYLCGCVCKDSGHLFWQVFWRFLCWIYVHNAIKYKILICLKPDVIAERDKMLCKIIWRLHLCHVARKPVFETLKMPEGKKKYLCLGKNLDILDPQHPCHSRSGQQERRHRLREWTGWSSFLLSYVWSRFSLIGAHIIPR